jgi:intein-encoded DNA endonuclease-like protein
MTDKIINLYKQGSSIPEIMGMLNMPSKRRYISKILKENKITRTHDSCKISLQRKRGFFKTIDTEEKAYWLGFLYADGCVHSNGNRICIGLSKKDKEHIEKFKEVLKLDNKTINLPQKDAVRVSFRDKQMHADLIKQGCVPRKSLILKPPENIPENLIRHFIRGLFDGDGCIYSIRKNKSTHLNRYGFTVAGSQLIIPWVKEKLSIKNNITTNIPKKSKKVKEPTCFYITTTELKKIKELYDYLYINSTVWLDRKYKIFTDAHNV